MKNINNPIETWDAYTVTEKIDIYTKALMATMKIFDDAKDADEACKAYDEAWEAFKEAEKAANETSEWKTVEKLRKALHEAEEAYWKTSEFKTQDEAYSAYLKAQKKARDEIDKVIKIMPTKFMGKELGWPF